MIAVSIAAKPATYQPMNKIRFVTATSLFDGHDASVNIMRRMLQASGAEVIHLGHNRSVQEIVNAALQEDVQGVAITSYQGGHVEFFKYMMDLLRENGGENIKVFGGGGGVIVPAEIRELMAYGVTRLYSPRRRRQAGSAGHDRRCHPLQRLRFVLAGAGGSGCPGCAALGQSPAPGARDHGAGESGICDARAPGGAAGGRGHQNPHLRDHRYRRCGQILAHR